MQTGHVAFKMEEVKRHLNGTYFCWMAGMEDDSVYHYRVQSPMIIIKFDHQRGIAFREHTKPYKDHIHAMSAHPTVTIMGKISCSSTTSTVIALNRA